MPTKKPGAPAMPEAVANSAKAKILGKGEKVAVKKGPVNPPPLPIHDAGKVVAAVKSKPASKK